MTLTEEEKYALGMAALALTLLGLILAIVWAASQPDQRAIDCEAGGNEVTSNSETSTGVGINPGTGQPVVTTGVTTTNYCLTPDGRIVDIW